jgi:hypothetical protein
MNMRSKVHFPYQTNFSYKHFSKSKHLSDLKNSNLFLKNINYKQEKIKWKNKEKQNETKRK